MLINTGISYPLLFGAMRSLNGAVRQIAGYDEWRRSTEDQRLRDINHTLAREIPFAPSKRVGNPNSVWSKVHFQMMLAGLRLLPKHPLWGRLESELLTGAQVRSYFKFVDDLLEHLACYEQARLCSLALQERLGDHEDGLVELLASHAAKYSGSDFGQFLKGVVGYLHEAGHEISITDWQREESDAQPSRPSLVGGLLRLLLPLFPAHPNDLSVEHKRLLAAASHNNLLGRIIQSFYADERGISYAEMGINASAEDYFGQNLHSRLLHYMDELANCPLTIRSLPKEPAVSLAEILMLYCSWYQKPQVVEMISPDFSGAGEDASLRLEEIFTSFLHKDGLQDLHYLWLPVPVWNELTQDEHLCYRLGKLASAMDAIGNIPGTLYPMSGGVLYELATHMWGDDARERMWGSYRTYLFSNHHGSYGMIEEVVIILQALRCNFRDHRLMLGEAYANTHLSLLDKHIGMLTDATFSDHELLEYFRAQHKDFIAIRNVAQKVAAMDRRSAACPDAIGYMLRYFGIELIEPLALPVNMLFRRLSIRIDEEAGRFEGNYNEYGQSVEISFPILEGHIPAGIRYVEKRVVEEGLIYPSYFSVTLPGEWEVLLPIPGRQGYDPMGVTGSPHHAEVIGFGCSYHHHALQSLLACAAAWGAEDAALREVQEKMMAIHPEHHKRHALAEWQLAQTIAAFRHGRRLSYAAWINEAVQLRLSYGHKHTSKYLRYVESGEQNHLGALRLPREYFVRMAWLHATYPMLYPIEYNKALGVAADAAWYDKPPDIVAPAVLQPSKQIQMVFG